MNSPYLNSFAILSCLILLSCPFFVNAQCPAQLTGINDPFADSRHFNPEVEGTISIPVVFHLVVREPEAITDQHVLDQLAILNEAFHPSNLDHVDPNWKHKAANPNIKFDLLTSSTDNRLKNGIIRKRTDKSFNRSKGGINLPGDNMIDLYSDFTGGSDPIMPAKCINIWVTHLSEVQKIDHVMKVTDDIEGFASYPTLPNNCPQTDGIVMNEAFFLQSKAKTNIQTIVHEMGHYLGLFHLWGLSNDTCGEDFIDDTPNHPNQGINKLSDKIGDVGLLDPHICDNYSVVNTCNEDFEGPYMEKNFMTYNIGQNQLKKFVDCRNFFTAGQVKWMRTQFNAGMPRAGLIQREQSPAPAPSSGNDIASLLHGLWVQDLSDLRFQKHDKGYIFSKSGKLLVARLKSWHRATDEITYQLKEAEEYLISEQDGQVTLTMGKHTLGTFPLSMLQSSQIKLNYGDSPVPFYKVETFPPALKKEYDAYESNHSFAAEFHTADASQIELTPLRDHRSRMVVMGGIRGIKTGLKGDRFSYMMTSSRSGTSTQEVELYEYRIDRGQLIETVQTTIGRNTKNYAIGVDGRIAYIDGTGNLWIKDGMKEINLETIIPGQIAFANMIWPEKNKLFFYRRGTFNLALYEFNLDFLRLTQYSTNVNEVHKLKSIIRGFPDSRNPNPPGFYISHDRSDRNSPVYIHSRTSGFKKVLFQRKSLVGQAYGTHGKNRVIDFAFTSNGKYVMILSEAGDGLSLNIQELRATKPKLDLSFRVAWTADASRLKRMHREKRKLTANIYSPKVNPLNNVIVGPNRTILKGKVEFSVIGNRISEVQVISEGADVQSGDVLADIEGDYFGKDNAWRVLKTKKELPGPIVPLFGASGSQKSPSPPVQASKPSQQAAPSANADPFSNMPHVRNTYFATIPYYQTGVRFQVVAPPSPQIQQTYLPRISQSIENGLKDCKYFSLLNTKGSDALYMALFEIRRIQTSTEEVENLKGEKVKRYHAQVKLICSLRDQTGKILTSSTYDCSDEKLLSITKPTSYERAVELAGDDVHLRVRAWFMNRFPFKAKVEQVIKQNKNGVKKIQISNFPKGLAAKRVRFLFAETDAIELNNQRLKQIDEVAQGKFDAHVGDRTTVSITSGGRDLMEALEAGKELSVFLFGK